MDTNPINEAVSSGRIEATDDVEGHGLSARGIVEPEPQDVEGHAGRSNGLVADDEDGDDTEGHGTKVHI